MRLRISAIYTLRYRNWKTNYRIYAFILWPGGNMTKTHLLNLGAKQLNIIERTRLLRLIVRLSKIPASNNYDGRMLYKIFKTYMKKEISKCYRTYFTNYITSAALINYGLNKEEDFTDAELNGQDKLLYEQAQRDFQVKAMNFYSKRGYDMNAVKDSLAGTQVNADTNTNDETGGSKPNVIKSATRPATRSAMIKQDAEDNIDDVDIDDGGDDDDFGY